MQIHKIKDSVKIFTRNLEEVSMQFPDIVAIVKSHIIGDCFIIDAEAVGYDPATGKHTPFQKISQRIKRKHNIEQIVHELPVELQVFDILFYGEVNMLGMPWSERRAFAENIIKPAERKITMVKHMVTDDKGAADRFFKEALADGFEGVLMKNVEAHYMPGKRVEGWVKLKQTMQELDLVIVGAEFGHGKRSEWFSSFTLACRDEDSGELKEVGKVSTGFKEKSEGLSFEQLTDLLGPLVTAEDAVGVKVRPEIVIEVRYEEIQKSPTYASGYALRFPRVSRLREDRSADDCSTLQEVEELYKEQRGNG